MIFASQANLKIYTSAYVLSLRRLFALCLTILFTRGIIQYSYWISRDLMFKKIFKKFDASSPLLVSSIIAFILLSYNIPVLLLQSGTMLDVVDFIALTGVTILGVYFISISNLLLRIVSIVLVLINSALLYLILSYKINIHVPFVSAVLSTSSLELISVNLIISVCILGLLPSYLIIKLTRKVDTKKASRIISLLVCVCIVAMVKFNVLKVNLPDRLSAFARSDSEKRPLLCIECAMSKYLPYNYIYIYYVTLHQPKS